MSSATRMTNGRLHAEGQGRAYAAGTVPGRFSDACESSSSGGSMRVEERTDMGERYLVDVTTGEKVIAGSRRPDGSYRKEIRVRPGYTPMEERRVFQTRQQLSRSDRQGGSAGGIPGANFAPGYVCPGVSPGSVNTSTERLGPRASVPSSTRTRQRNRGANKKERTGGAGGADEKAVEALCSGMQGVSIEGGGESTTGTQTHTQERSEIETLQKKSRNLKKKLKDIEALEKKKSEAQALTEEQLQKCARRGEVEEEIRKIEERLGELEELEK